MLPGRRYIGKANQLDLYELSNMVLRGTLTAGDLLMFSYDREGHFPRSSYVRVRDLMPYGWKAGVKPEHNRIVGANIQRYVTDACYDDAVFVATAVGEAAFK